MVIRGGKSMFRSLTFAQSARLIFFILAFGCVFLTLFERYTVTHPVQYIRESLNTQTGRNMLRYDMLESGDGTELTGDGVKVRNDNIKMDTDTGESENTKRFSYDFNDDKLTEDNLKTDPVEIITDSVNESTLVDDKLPHNSYIKRALKHSTFNESNGEKLPKVPLVEMNVTQNITMPMSSSAKQLNNDTIIKAMTTTRMPVNDSDIIITLKPHLAEMINATRNVTTLKSAYLLQNPTLCSSVKDLDLLIIVHTATDHFDKRLSMRETWTNQTVLNSSATIRTLFLLGTTKYEERQKKIEEEFKEYGDLLQGDFIDTYQNLSLKGVMAYMWITESCRNAKVILKVDDDVMFNMFEFLEDFLPDLETKSRQIYCRNKRPGVGPIHREKTSRWYQSQDHFRGLNTYPTNSCYGFLVILTSDLIPLLYRSAQVTPLFWIDDIWLFGLLSESIPGGVEFVGLSYKWKFRETKESMACFENETAHCDFMSTTARTRGEFHTLWRHIVKRHSMPHRTIIPS